MSRSFWERGHSGMRSDLTIVGGGFAGLNLALAVKERNPSSSVRILEAGSFSLGASRKNAGFLCYGSPSELLDDAESADKSSVLRTVLDRWEGLSRIRSLFPPEKIGIEANGGYELFLDEAAFQRVEKEIPELNKALKEVLGFAPYAPIPIEELKRMGFDGIHGGYRIEGEASADPYLLHSALCQRVRELGTDLHFGSRVKGFREGEHGVEVQVEGMDEPLETVNLVLATNGFTETLLAGSGIDPARGQVLITEPIEGLPFEGTFHMEGGNYYFRNVGKRVLLGGGRHADPEGERTTKEGIAPAIRKRLEELLRERILPGREFRIEENWSGIMGFTENKYPRLEKVGERSYLMGGFSGMGVALSFNTAPMLAEKLLSDQERP